MNNLSYFLFSVFYFVFFSSCEEIINPDLKTVAPVVVIDAWLTNLEGGSYVTLTKSVSYGEIGEVPKISNASVKVVEVGGRSIFFEEKEAGYYAPIDTSFKGEINKTYVLEVQVEDIKYEATAKVLGFEPIDSITFILKESVPFFDDGYYSILHYQEQKNIDNFYYYNIWANKQLLNKDKISIFDDNVFSGQYLDLILVHTLNQNDTVKVELFNLEENAYRYYAALKLLAELGSPSQTNPENPISNISNGALGFFTAAAVSTQTEIVK